MDMVHFAGTHAGDAHVGLLVAGELVVVAAALHRVREVLLRHEVLVRLVVRMDPVQLAIRLAHGLRVAPHLPKGIKYYLVN